MANELLWLPKTVESVITTTEMDNVVDESLILGPTDYANLVNKYRFADFLLFGTFGTPADAGAFAELHLFYKVDGTNYGDGEDGDLGGPVASSNSLHGIFQVGAKTIIYQQVLMVPLGPRDFRVGIKFFAGQDLIDAGSHFVKIAPFNEQLQ